MRPSSGHAFKRSSGYPMANVLSDQAPEGLRNGSSRQARVKGGGVKGVASKGSGVFWYSVFLIGWAKRTQAVHSVRCLVPAAKQGIRAIFERPDPTAVQPDLTCQVLLQIDD
jgi:hypothetical protein